MSLQSLQGRLTALQDTVKQVEELIDRLANIKFQPGSVPLDDEDGDVSAEISSEIHQTLKEQAEDFELLYQEAHDLPSGRSGSDHERDKEELCSRVARAGQELKLARVSFRKAQLTAKRNLELAQRAERALLSSLPDLSSSTESLFVPRRKNLASSMELTKEEKMVNASSDVTAALRRTHQLMETELSRSQFAHDTLKESTAALAQLSETYSTLNVLLSSSRNLLGTLLRSQKSDTWYLETAFYILVFTIAWLIFRRFIYGPAWWLLWLPLKMFYKAWMGVFTVVGLRGSRDGVFTSVEVVGTTSVPGMSTFVADSSATGAPGRSPVLIGTALPEGSIPGSGGKDSIVEEVGKIIDNGQQAGSVVEQDQGSSNSGHVVGNAKDRGSEDRNPKKRMWEKPGVAQTDEQWNKDEV